MKRGGTNIGDGTVIFYVICAEWIEKWKAFIQGDAPVPDQINNMSLTSFIKQKRLEQ